MNTPTKTREYLSPLLTCRNPERREKRLARVRGEAEELGLELRGDEGSVIGYYLLDQMTGDLPISGRDLRIIEAFLMGRRSARPA